MKTSSDVMTKNPVVALPDDTVASVAQLMKDRDIGPVPIVEDKISKKLVGIVTDRDLAIKVVAEGLDPRTTPVKDVMTRDVVTCHEEDEIAATLEAMSKHQLRRILVVDADGSLVGIIAQADVATRMNEPETTGEVVKEISQ
ncbi:MAG: CBS domain-containing protein [Chloroflexota bacterium]